MKRIAHPLYLLTFLAVATTTSIYFSRGGVPARQVSVKKAEQRSFADSALAIVLTPLEGDGTADVEIRELQKKIQSATDRHALLERLGWAFINKARLSSDPGFYKLAEQCADAMVSGGPASPDAELLRGHIYHALHRFKEAEAIARKLVAQREFVLDFALLGDALMEQGKLTEAVNSYQRMVDLKPCLQTYSRVAHMRWLKGDLPGAIEVMRVAISSGSPKEPEPVAWACSQLARYEMQVGAPDLASAAIDAALQQVPDYKAALLQRGRLLILAGKDHDALPYLQKAAERNPLPEYLWTLADALRLDGDLAGAEKVETQLKATGAANDPRTFSLFLASRRINTSEALSLAQSELETRRDTFTSDALAWSEFASGDIEKALHDIDLAHAEGTQDARLFYHAGEIFAASDEKEKAAESLKKAIALGATLMPSERAALTKRAALRSVAVLPQPALQTITQQNPTNTTATN